MKSMRTYLDAAGRTRLLWSAGCAFSALLLILSRAAITCVQSSPADAADSSGLHLGLVVGCAAIATVTVCILLYSVIKYEATAKTGERRFHPLGEFFWALVPVIILFGTAAPSVSNLVTSGNSINQPASMVASYRCTMTD